MTKLAKVLIMLIRLIWIVEIGLGIWIGSAKGLPYLKAHIGLGFTFALLLAILALMALGRRKVGLGIVGLIVAVLMPVVGLKQFPLKFGPAMGAIQYTHVVVALVAIGIAEALHGRIRKSV